MSIERSNEMLNATSAATEDSGLSRLGGVTLGQLVERLNWNNGPSAEKFLASPWAYQETSVMQRDPATLKMTPEPVASADQEVEMVSVERSGIQADPIPSDDEYDATEPNDSMEADEEDTSLTVEVTAVSSDRDALLADEVVAQETEPTDVASTQADPVQNAEPQQGESGAAELTKVETIETTASVAESPQAHRPSQPASSKMNVTAAPTAPPARRPTPSQRPAISADEYLTNLEQLVIELNMELCLAPTGGKSDSAEAQIEALTQRIINLSLENLQLRRQLANGTPSAAN